MNLQYNYAEVKKELFHHDRNLEMEFFQPVISAKENDDVLLGCYRSQRATLLKRTADQGAVMTRSQKAKLRWLDAQIEVLRETKKYRVNTNESEGGVQ